MTISINDIHKELFEGIQYFLSQEKPECTSDIIDTTAKQFADDNAERFFYLDVPRTGELFGNEDVQDAYGLSGHCRLWICKMLDDSFQVGFDAGNGWYEPIGINGEIFPK